MGYSDDDSIVRVDFFKASGKWYETEAVKWTGSYDEGLIHDEFAKSLRDHLEDDRFKEMDAVCLEPYHAHGYPIQIKAGGWLEKRDDQRTKQSERMPEVIVANVSGKDLDIGEGVKFEKGEVLRLPAKVPEANVSKLNEGIAHSKTTCQLLDDKLTVEIHTSVFPTEFLVASLPDRLCCAQVVMKVLLKFGQDVFGSLDELFSPEMKDALGVVLAGTLHATVSELDRGGSGQL